MMLWQGNQNPGPPATAKDDDDSSSISSTTSSVGDDDGFNIASTETMDTTAAVQQQEATSAHTQMVSNARYILEQIDAVQCASKDCDLQCREIDEAETCLDAVPPKLLAVTFDESANSVINDFEDDDDDGPSDDDDEEEALFQLRLLQHNKEQQQLTTNNVMAATPTSLRRHSASLADDLSSCGGGGGAVAESPTSMSDAEQQQQQVMIQELQHENRRLLEMVQTLSKAATKIQTNADLKIVRLEFEIAHLRQQLSDELATNSKYAVLNQSLRKQIQTCQGYVLQKKDNSPADREKYHQVRDLHKQELTVEKHLNALITSRNLAVKESTALKKLLLGTCVDCRKRLPLKQRRSNASSASDDRASQQQQQQNSSKASSAPRPTFQSSARRVLENLPRQPARPTTTTNAAAMPSMQEQRSLTSSSSPPHSPVSSARKSSSSSLVDRTPSPTQDSPSTITTTTVTDASSSSDEENNHLAPPRAPNLPILHRDISHPVSTITQNTNKNTMIVQQSTKRTPRSSTNYGKSKNDSTPAGSTKSSLSSGRRKRGFFGGRNKHREAAEA